MTNVKTMLSALPMPAVYIETSRRFAAANDDALALLGAQIVGRSFIAILRQPSVIAGIEGCMADQQPRTLNYVTQDGAQDTTYDVSCRAFGDDDGVLLCFLDTTAQEQTDQMRRDFVANVSHELRTPLTAIIGFIETLQGPARDDASARERFLDVMATESHRMNRLIADLLSLSRVEAQERVRPTETVSLGDALTSTIASLRPLAEQRNITLDFTQPATPVKTLGDVDQLRQVFTNLIENGIKYGGSGGNVQISLTVPDQSTKSRTPSARIDITDTGAGIANHHLARLTERFYRADSHRSRELGGTGLGLAIVKHIVNRHRGRLLIDSILGQGSTFSVVLPLPSEKISHTPKLS